MRWAWLWVMGACSPVDPASEAPSDTAADSDAPVGDAGVALGGFLVRLVAPEDSADGYTSVFGKVYDGATPQAIVWEPQRAEGDCVLSTPRVPYCAEPCGGAAVCVEDDTCQPYPASQALGAVTLRGLNAGDGSTSFSMDPIANTYQKPASVQLTWPPFGEGDEVVAQTSGSDWSPAFEVTSRGVSPLSLSGDALVAEAGVPLPLRWDAATKPDNSRITVQLDLSHHGGSKGMVSCDTADDGSLELSGALMTDLLALGVAGYPTVIVAREAVGSTTIAAGRVDLAVRAEVEVAVQIPGLISCTEDEACPDGQSCRDDLTCG